MAARDDRLAVATRGLDPAQPVLIAGPTASGKSALAMAIVAAEGGVVVNADALQVYDRWPLLTAQPTGAERAALPHALYGHVPFARSHSVGDWLRDLAPLLAGPLRPVIVGGTGLYFAALTEGLAEVPPVPPEVRQAADAMTLDALLADLDPATAAGIDRRNRARVQRAWEVLAATGRGLAQWQAATPAPLLPLAAARAIVLRPEVAALDARIAARFDAMLAAGALDEARAMLPHWDPALPSSKAIGAADLIAHLQGQISLAEARDRAVLRSRQYAKRQRTWARSRMSDWLTLQP